MNEKPFVSIIIPCYNEEQYIASCLDSIISNDYGPAFMEVVVIDGLSKDNTRQILLNYQQRHPFIKMIDNPLRFKPNALNLGIKAAKGGIIIRMDAHATYEPDYIRKSVHYLMVHHADNVGGIRKTVPASDARLSRAIAHAISLPFAVGNATYRTGAKEKKWVDTVFGGCYRRDIFEKIGFFDESLIRGQDREFNIRLQRAGGKILLAPDIICHYHARGDLGHYLRWIFAGGLTPFYISRLTRKVIFSYRNLVPPLFVMSLIGSLLLAGLSPLFALLFFGILGIYFAAASVSSIPVARQEKDNLFLVLMPFMFLVTHITYGAGALAGLLKPVEPRSEWTKV